MRGVQRALRHGVAVMAGVVAACARLGPPPEPPVCVTVPFEPPEQPPPAGPPRLAPLAGNAPFVDLEVPGFLDAVVSVPLGATSPRPLLVAAHGAGERPEWACKLWRDIVADRAFVLCPRGYPESPTDARAGFYYPSHLALGAEIESAMAALIARYRIHVDPAAPIFAGSGQAAIQGAMLLPHHPSRFSRAVLIEGGPAGEQEWTRHSARRYRGRGGERVLFLCGCGECAATAGTAEGHLKRAGVSAQVVYIPGALEVYEGPLGLEVARGFPWLTAGDARFGAPDW